MSIINKTIFIVSIFFISLLYVNNVNSITLSKYCTGAQVCSSYNIDCKSVLDGFCPEKYGNWSSCDPQTFGKCIPCDPDCGIGICGKVELIAPLKANPGEMIKLIVTAKLSETPDTINLLKGIDLAGLDIGLNSQCNTGETSCAREFTYQLPNTGGDYICFTATTNGLKPSGVKATKCVAINPEVQVQLLTLSSYGIIPVNVNVKSIANVTKSELYIFKKDPKTNQFRPVKVDDINSNDYCSFTCISSYGSTCNLLETKTYPGTSPVVDSIFNWDSTKCDNKEFRLEGYGYDTRNNYNNDTKTITLNNPNPACVDECYIFNSQVLNTIYIKIKSWIV
ncbi:MAG: hypothetical protein AABX61_01975 [Nanoarchaeota archaeon]